MTELADLMAEGVVVLDGALSTELEIRGVDTSSALWGAVALASDPEAIRAVHTSYFEAGAQVATTNTYQASVPAFEAVGFSHADAVRLIARGAELAQEASEAWDAAHPGAKTLVAGSIGPYGAYLADGSEYTGGYQLSAHEYADFHRPRIEALAQAGVGLFAVETQPKLDETQAVIDLLVAEFPERQAWVSFQLSEPEALADGTPLAEALRWADEQPAVVAVGFNCVPPSLVTPALRALSDTLGEPLDAPLLCYPNSGDRYEPITKTWHDAAHHDRFTAWVPEWLDLGVRAIGGCCRTNPADIAVVSRLVAER